MRAFRAGAVGVAAGAFEVAGGDGACDEETGRVDLCFAMKNC